MSDGPHPFEQYPTEHPGWDRKYFKLMGRTWSLLVIERPDERTSMISLYNDSHNSGPWPHWHSLSMVGLLTVDGAVKVIEAVFLAHKAGATFGADQARRELRHALGIGQ